MTYKSQEQCDSDFRSYFMVYTLCRPFSEAVRRWMPVDLYVGGVEHGRWEYEYVTMVLSFSVCGCVLQQSCTCCMPGSSLTSSMTKAFSHTRNRFKNY